MDFVKPGKNVFVVKTPGKFGDGHQKKTGIYVHKFLGTQRLEEITP